MAGLSVLYFPYAYAPLEMLKEAALYFDEIYCIDPTAIGGTPSLADEPIEPTAEPSKWSEFWQLIDAGVCRAKKPEEVRSQWDSLLTESIIADLQDKHYVQLCARSDWDTWSLAYTKLSEGLVDELQRLAKDVCHEIPSSVREWIASQVTFMEPRFREGFHLGESTEYVDLPFVLGESILVNLAMCACASLELSPLTDERFHYHVLKTKYARAQRDQDLRELLAIEGIIQSMTEEALWRDVMRTTLPPICDLPVDRVLDLRHKFKSQLDDFRVEMATLAQEIQEQPWEPNFDARVKQIVNTNLRPRLRALKWDLKRERDRYWREEAPDQLRREIFKADWLINVLTGAPVIGVLLGAGQSLYNLVSSWVRYKKGEQELKRNGLTYLLQIQRVHR
jgi:hypothetical protein